MLVPMLVPGPRAGKRTESRLLGKWVCPSVCAGRVCRVRNVADMQPRRVGGAAVGAALLACTALRSSCALENGFVKPALGWSSWYAAPMGSQVTDAFVRASAKALITSGLAKKGYKYVNVDEGWLKGRYPGNNTICTPQAPTRPRSLALLVAALPAACREECHCATCCCHSAAHVRAHLQTKTSPSFRKA